MDAYAQPTGMLGMFLCCAVVAPEGDLQSSTLCPRILNRAGGAKLYHPHLMSGIRQMEF
jgi:hypothetical protein